MPEKIPGLLEHPDGLPEQCGLLRLPWRVWRDLEDHPSLLVHSSAFLAASYGSIQTAIDRIEPR